MAWNWARWTGRQESKSAPPLVALTDPGGPNWGGRDGGALTRDGYLRNAVAYRCVRMVAEAAASVPLVTAHEGAARLIRQPVPDVSGIAFLEGVYTQLQLHGNASLYGIPDQSGDVVRAGAFARSLRSGAALPMLLQHRQGALAGRWTWVREDGRGLFVRGLIEKAGVAGLVRGGLAGLSIGFRPRVWKPLAGGGRELIELELVEISLVETPMQARARFEVLGAEAA